MTKQEMFNTVYIALYKQGKPAMGGTSCVYRAEDGSKCAAGHLISDEEYANLETTSPNYKVNIMGLVGIKKETLPARIVDNLYFVKLLQRAHDDPAKFPSDWLELWKSRMKEIALCYDLTIPEIPA